MSERRGWMNNMKIYTKTGDKGETSLFGGQRVPKDDLFVEAYGTVDELNSCLGLAIAMGEIPLEITEMLVQIQNFLFVVGSDLATPLNSPIRSRNDFPTISDDDVAWLEQKIDDLSEKLPPLKSFILPGGHKGSAFLHFCRTVCRRAERRVISLKGKEKINEKIIVFLNRLSDLLFVMARTVNHYNKIEDVSWKKPQTKK